MPKRRHVVSPLIVHHTLGAPEMFEEEVKIILSWLEWQLVQQLLGRRCLREKKQIVVLKNKTRTQTTICRHTQ